MTGKYLQVTLTDNDTWRAEIKHDARVLAETEISKHRETDWFASGDQIPIEDLSDEWHDLPNIWKTQLTQLLAEAAQTIEQQGTVPDSFQHEYSSHPITHAL